MKKREKSHDENYHGIVEEEVGLSVNEKKWREKRKKVEEEKTNRK